MKRSIFSFLTVKVITLLVFSLSLGVSTVQAQSFEEGLSLYQKGEYEQSAPIFSNLNTDKGMLFAGKSYFGMGKYLTSKTYLNQLTKDTKKELYLEAQYQLALADFQLGNYGTALSRLQKFNNERRKTQLVTDALQFYEDILSFLTMNQRKNAFQQVESPQIKYDLAASAIGKVDYPVAKILYDQLEDIKIDTSSKAMRDLQKILSDSVSYAVEQTFSNRINSTPDGITYNIGAALPSYKSDAREYQVAQGLYYGFVLAAEKFNQRHPDKKAFIRYQNTAAHKDTAAHKMTNMAWKYNVDAVLGPLFSEPAKRMAELAEQYQIPMLPPLANSDSLSISNPYVYQANSTFVSHGKRMAKYAVEELDMDTLAVLAERNSRGEASSYAFRDEAERRGARVVHFFVEDLASKGFELTEYTKYFTTDTAKIDSAQYHQLDGVYAPFTGQAASSLGELLLADLQAMNSKLPVLGSPAWGNMNIPEEQLGNRKVYFSESYYVNSKSPKVKQFQETFTKRFDTDPNRFAMIGYDTATFVLKTLNRIGNPAQLKDALQNQPVHKGLANNISFDGSHVNKEVKVFVITRDGIQPVMKD
ncbi:ABC-type branched-chain amino acid transport system, substrate-binding protein [Fodinibius salinus]|uniref:ABC-type branched-chain amino acid transport system, substrate-binding protein n=1 Tax=Fodinibius salinus TaxID=860790 RepID=A0A5D3YMT6_9BACT|nr:ABC transporter substrate-binding protein [Fodinibius salinus]TYP95184.1 ABC-type branched-chain amino acid transport system, substrate-binding protein [Fodinibius salinus]